jgi:NAD(P)-dependent dehydrogenase (short-subunit alcohol dehydrogenase family)
MMALPVTPSFRLDGKLALVTGASRGIGLGCAAALAAAGSHVVCAGRTRTDLEGVVAEIEAAGGSASVLELHLSKPTDFAPAITAAGPFDILVNNAGEARHGPFLETKPEDFDAVVALNFRGTYFVSQVVAKAMADAGKAGSIISISSQMGHVGGIDRAVYSATKHALEGFTKSAAIELGHKGIRFNTICPTFVRTALTDTTLADPARRDWIMSNIKLGRLAEVQDIMGAVVFLASDAAAMITGTSIVIDGGWTAA